MHFFNVILVIEKLRRRFDEISVDEKSTSFQCSFRHNFNGRKINFNINLLNCDIHPPTIEFLDSLSLSNIISGNLKSILSDHLP